MAKKLSELLLSDDVVVEYGDKKQVNTQTGKVETIEKARKQVITKAGFDSIDINEQGYSEALGRSVKLLGTPKYKEEPSPINTKDKISVLDGFEKFAAEKAEKEIEPPAA